MPRPLHHPDAGVLWEIAQKEGITVFGISAGYIAALMNSGLKPGEKYDLGSIRAVLSGLSLNLATWPTPSTRCYHLNMDI